jgi:hypothetical protein
MKSRTAVAGRQTALGDMDGPSSARLTLVRYAHLSRQTLYTFAIRIARSKTSAA